MYHLDLEFSRNQKEYQFLTFRLFNKPDKSMVRNILQLIKYVRRYYFKTQ